MFVRQWFQLAAAAFAFVAVAAGAQPFGRIEPAQPTEGGGKVEVIEFFWYGCPHCYNLEPNVVAWAKHVPKDVVFKRVPAVPSDAWAGAARMFYTLEAMGLLEQYHQRVFDAIHKSNVNMNNPKFRDQWLAKNGIDPVKYAQVEKSFSVATHLNRAKQLTFAYKVDSVPRVAVNGRYFTTAEMAGSLDNVFKVVDQLIGMARREAKS